MIENKLPDGRYRFKESFILTKENYEQIPLKESTKEIIIEQNGEKKTIKPECGYRFKIWKEKSFNKNKRNYDEPISLIIEEKPTTIGLMNHPEGDVDGDPTRIYAVQKNPCIKEGWLTVECYFVGQYGKLIKEVLELGGPVGISSSALGHLDESGNVKKEGFFLERYGDIVLNPSNGYFHDMYEDDMKVNESNNKEKEVTILIDDTNKIQENVRMNNVEQKMLNSNVKNIFREAEKSSNLSEKKDLYTDILEYSEVLEDKTLISKAESLLEKVNEDIAELAEKGKDYESLKEKVETLETEKSTLTEENKVLKESIEELKKEHNTLTELYDKNISELEESNSKLAIIERDNDELISKFDEKEDEEDKEDSDSEKKDKKDSKEDEIEEDEDEEDKKDKEDEEEIEEAEDKDKEDKEDEEDSDSEDEIEEEDEDEEEEEDDKDKEDKKDKVKESTLVSDDIYKYYKDSKKLNPKISSIRKKIYDCKNLEEAQELVLNFTEKSKEDSKTFLERVQETRQKKTGKYRSVSEVIDEQNGGRL